MVEPTHAQRVVPLSCMGFHRDTYPQVPAASTGLIVGIRASIGQTGNSSENPSFADQRGESPREWRVSVAGAPAPLMGHRRDSRCAPPNTHSKAHQARGLCPA